MLSIADSLPALVFLIIMETLFITLLIWGYKIFQNSIGNQEYKNYYTFIFIKKGIKFLDLIFRTFLIMPLNWIILNTFKNSN